MRASWTAAVNSEVGSSETFWPRYKQGDVILASGSLLPIWMVY